MKNKKAEDCPHCGRCPQCGRKDAAPIYYPVYPMQPWYPVQPTYPWTSTWNNADFQLQQNQSTMNQGVQTSGYQVMG